MADQARYLRYRGKHIQEGERYYIEAELRKGTPVSAIAKSMNRPRETVYREIKKGSVGQRRVDSSGKVTEVMLYFADVSKRVSAERQSSKGSALKIGSNHELARAIEHLIRDPKYKYSPDAALLQLESDGWGELFCTKTLYNYIHAGVLNLSMEDLPLKGKQRKRNEQIYRRAHHNIAGKSIEQRPKEVQYRNTFGHWEGDFIVGAQKTRPVVLTLVERKTRKLITAKFATKEALHVVAFFDKLEQLYGKNFCKIFKSVTFDNGKEFSKYMELERSCGHCGCEDRTEIFYAHPYCSSERGTNEVTNKFLRRRIPKSSNIGNYSDDYVKEATEWINSYPRRILRKQGHLNANEAFHYEIQKLR